MSQEHLQNLDRILGMARGEAARLGHDYIGTEHLLLALLLLDDPEVRAIFDGAGVTSRRIRERLEEALHPGRSRAELPLTTRAQKVLRLAETEMSEDREEGLKPVHVLRGILQERLNIAAQVLGDMGFGYSPPGQSTTAGLTRSREEREGV